MLMFDMGGPYNSNLYFAFTIRRSRYPSGTLFPLFVLGSLKKIEH